MKSLQETIYDELYSTFINQPEKINLNDLYLFLVYTIKHYNYLINYLFYDIIRILYRDNNLNYFFKIYLYCSQFIKIDKYILTNLNTNYFKDPRFGKIFLCNLNVKTNFKNNFDLYTSGIFDNFKWSNCIVAGGTVFKIIQEKFDNSLDKYKYSDIDIFLYGKTKTKKKKIRYIIDYFTEKLKQVYIVNFNNVLSLISPNYSKEIQIIIGNYKTPLQILNDFDLTHLQLLYNGNTIQATNICSECLCKKETYITKYKINENLIYKINTSELSLRFNDRFNKEDYLEFLDNYDCIENLIDDVIDKKQRDYYLIKKIININKCNTNIDKETYIVNTIANLKNIAICRIFPFNLNQKSLNKEIIKYIRLNFNGTFDDGNFYLSEIFS